MIQERNRQIGILAIHQYFHQIEKVDYLDISYEKININTSTFGNRYPITQAQVKIIQFTKIIIEDLNDVIEELREHRDRMVVELIELDKEESNIIGEKIEK